MFEADWTPSSWDDEDGQRRHLADGDPVTPTPAPPAGNSPTPTSPTPTPAKVKKPVVPAPTKTAR
jgi:hypothetical protein